jgi:hypothetical protein
MATLHGRSGLVVQRYIETFTRPGDVTLDPFGGTGVTLIESIILGRKGIHVDINPLSTFIVETLVTSIDLPTLVANFDNVVKEFTRRRPKTDAEIQDTLKKYPYPSCVALPKTSDVGEVSELFTPKQLAELALLKSLMLTVQDKAARQHLLLMFSGLLNKVNLTYHGLGGALRWTRRQRSFPVLPVSDCPHLSKSRPNKSAPIEIQESTGGKGGTSPVSVEG